MGKRGSSASANNQTGLGVTGLIELIEPNVYNGHNTQNEKNKHNTQSNTLTPFPPP